MRINGRVAATSGEILFVAYLNDTDNLTVTGPVANIIVVERARKEANITFSDYFRVGLPATVLTMAFGYVWLSLAK